MCIFEQSILKIINFNYEGNEMYALTSEKNINIINDRWYFLHGSMHCVGIVLDPEW